MYYLTLECGCAGEDEAAAFLPTVDCRCDTGSADVLVRSGSERGRSRSHVECLFSSVTHQGITGQSLMTWDADGNRVSFTSSTNPGNPHTFVYDTTAGRPAVIEEVKPSGATGGSGTVYYIREPNGALIARVEGSTIQYYHFDALGSTRLLTNSTGAVTDTYSYDAWGVTNHDSGSTSQPYQYVGQLGYYTHYQDTNLPILQLGVRFYDPALGRFTQMDSIWNGGNLYTYADSNPTWKVDPNGDVPSSYKSWYQSLGKQCTKWEYVADVEDSLTVSIAYRCFSAGRSLVRKTGELWCRKCGDGYEYWKYRIKYRPIMTNPGSNAGPIPDMTLIRHVKMICNPKEECVITKPGGAPTIPDTKPVKGRKRGGEPSFGACWDTGWWNPGPIYLPM